MAGRDGEGEVFDSLLGDIFAFSQRCYEENGLSSRMYLEPDEWDLLLRGLNESPRYARRNDGCERDGSPPRWVRIGMVEVMPR